MLYVFASIYVIMIVSTKHKENKLMGKGLFVVKVSVVMMMLGMIGEYLGRLYISQNKNPQYVIRETTRDEND